MIVRVISTEKVLFDGSAERLTLPGACGPFTVLNGHAPLISTLVPGEIVYTVAGKESRLQVKGGIVEVRDNRVTVCIG